MMGYPKYYDDTDYIRIYKNSKGKWIRQKIAGSTVATSNFLGLICREYPDKTIAQLREILTDKTKYIRNYDAICVLDAHIAKELGDEVPDWKEPIELYHQHRLDGETDMEYFARKRRERREARERRKRNNDKRTAAD